MTGPAGDPLPIEVPDAAVVAAAELVGEEAEAPAAVLEAALESTAEVVGGAYAGSEVGAVTGAAVRGAVPTGAVPKAAVPAGAVLKADLKGELDPPDAGGLGLPVAVAPPLAEAVFS